MRLFRSLFLLPLLLATAAIRALASVAAFIVDAMVYAPLQFLDDVRNMVQDPAVHAMNDSALIQRGRREAGVSRRAAARKT